MAIRATPPTAPLCSSTASRGAWLAGYRWTCSPSTLPTIPRPGWAAGSNYGARTCRSAPWRRSSAAFPTSCCATRKGCRASIPGLEKNFPNSLRRHVDRSVVNTEQCCMIRPTWGRQPCAASFRLACQKNKEDSTLTSVLVCKPSESSKVFPSANSPNGRVSPTALSR